MSKTRSNDTKNILLSSPWARARGAMFRGKLGKTVLVFAYPHTAPRVFQTFFCPPLHILALSGEGKIVYDQIISPNHFVKIPASCIIIESDPDIELPPLDEFRSLGREPQPAQGAWDESASLGSLFFALMAQAVADVRRVNEVHQRSGSVRPETLQEKFAPWERGQILGSAGFILDHADVYELPQKAISLSNQLIHLEQPHLVELLAASVAGGPWKQDFSNACLRCGKGGSWRPAVLPPPDVGDSVWRYERPENAVPLCHKCAARLKWNRQEGIRIDLVWGLWGPRFEAFWGWHTAALKNNLPEDWDKLDYPLWPAQFGGQTWECGSGAEAHADPRPPQGIQLSGMHQDALARGLGVGTQGRGHLQTSPRQKLVELVTV